MQHFYAYVDRPSLRIEGRTFHGGITIHGQPTYGRVLFTHHDALIKDNHFYGLRADAALTVQSCPS